MPPSAAASSHALVHRGPRDVSRKQGPGGLVPRPKGVNPAEKTTASQAIALRHGQNGVLGPQDLVFKHHYSGPQKLAIRAHELESALATPFNFEQLVSIAVSQMDLQFHALDLLQDPEFFHDRIKAAIEARPEYIVASKDPKKNLLSQPSYVARQIGACIHNICYLASSWRMLFTHLVYLARHGVTDANVRDELRRNQDVRDHFLLMYLCVDRLVLLGHEAVSQLIVCAPEYQRYFTLDSQQNVRFDAKRIRDAHKSFLDTVLVELALRNSSYPLNVLMICLKDVLHDAPAAKKRIPQNLFDTIGDLSWSITFRDMLETVLRSMPEANDWFANRGDPPPGYARYEHAEVQSLEASELVGNFKELVVPLSKTKDKATLDRVWKEINNNYVMTTGEDVEELWQLENGRKRKPQWSTYTFTSTANDSDSDSDAPKRKKKALVLHKSAKKKGSAPSKKRLAITARGEDPEEDVYADMPDLLSVTDSSSSATEDDSSEEEEDDEEDEANWEDESDFGASQESLFREFMDEAMQFDLEHLDEQAEVPEDVQNNPFIRFMRQLKGRITSLDPRLKAGTAEKRPFFGPPRPPKPSAATSAPKPAAPKPPPTQKTSAPQQPATQKATVEEVVDEEAGGKKKKKKKKKKAKKAGDTSVGSAQVQTAVPASAPVSPAPAPSTPARPPAASPTPGPSTSAQVKKSALAPAKPTQPTRDPNDVISSFDPLGSRVSLALGPETAQSMRSYLQSQQQEQPKPKVKSRPEAPSPAPSNEPFKKGFLKGAFGGSPKKKDDEGETKKKGFFARMPRFNIGKKVSKLMHQIISPTDEQTRGKKGMRWDDFVKAMKGMGFEVDPSTAGSSVRFTPPGGDCPITFHKPHPDSTIHPVMLLEFGKRLRKLYGWTPEQFAGFETEG